MTPVLVLLACLAWTTAADIHCDVIVIGAGGTGAHFGVFASDNGHNVCLLEIQPRIGGHCTDRAFTPPFNNQSHISLGFLLFHNTTKNNERGFGNYTVGGAAGLAGHFGRFGTVIQFPRFGNKTTYTMDAENNFGVDSHPPTPLAFLEPFVTSAANYIQATYPQIESGPNPDMMPEILTKTLPEFLEADPTMAQFAGLLLPTAQASAIVPFDERSAWDVLKTNEPSFLMGFIEDGFMLTYRDGCRAAYTNMTTYLQAVTNNKLFLNATVKKITRPHAPQSNGKVSVHFTINNGPIQHLIGDKLVIAIPPTLENMEKIGMKLQPAEHAVYQHMFVSPGYFSAQFETAANMSYLQNNNTERPFLENNLDVTPVSLFLCEFINSSGNNGPCHGFAVASEPGYTLEEMADEIEHELDLMRLLPNPVNFTLTDLIEHEGYCPLFRQQALANDRALYGKLNDLQGQYNTWWIGAGPSYCGRTMALEHAYRIAQQFFA